jgi:hypothetical protein
MMAIAPEDRIRQVTATTRRPATSSARPTSSVPTTPVNRNIPTEPVDPTPNRAVLAPNQYPMKEIVTNTGQKVMVYTSGPLAGQDENGNFPIQATDPAAFAPVTPVRPVTPVAPVTPVTGGTATLPVTPVGLTPSQLQRKSAYDLLYTEFKKYGLESLVEDVKGLIMTATSDAEITMGLRASKNYEKRFAANKQRIANGFAAIDEATYLALEDKYQQIAQNYGLPEKYYSRGDLGVQQYFADAIAKNIDPVTFEERIMEGKKLLNANKLVLDTARTLYPELNDGDFLDFVLNPQVALSDIKRKVSAAEIGAAQRAAGLQATRAGTEALVAENITGARYQQAAPTISEAAIRGSQLASMYGESPYTQETAEQAVLNTAGSAEAIRQTRKLAGLETASFSGQSGRGAIDRERAGQV